MEYHLILAFAYFFVPFELTALIIISATSPVGCGVYPRPKREGVKPSPTAAETMIMAELTDVIVLDKLKR